MKKINLNKYDVGGELTMANAIYDNGSEFTNTGNPYIDALPLPLTEFKDLNKKYTQIPELYDEEIERQKPNLLKRIAVESLYTGIKVYLPFEGELEMRLHNALRVSYNSRQLQKGIYDTGTSRLLGSTGSGTNAGFSLLGYSGCGKSSAIEKSESQLPQVIKHTFDDGTIDYQITFINVSCYANSNLSALYTSIGDQVDKALNLDVWGKKMRKTHSLSDKQSVVERLIESYKIGIIVIDEIQLMDFKSQRESSFESLMVIQNNTKVAIAVVGTEDAYQSMFTKARTTRRLGSPIQANHYCENKKYYASILNIIWKYQWFDEHIDLTSEMADAFYEETKGIIAHTITLFVTLQEEYLKSNPRFEVTPDILRKISQVCYPNMHRLLDDMQNPDNMSKIEKIIKDAKIKYETELSDIKQNEAMDDFIANQALAEKEANIEEAVKTIWNIEGDNYKLETIREVVQKLSEKEKDTSPSNLSKKGMQKLKKLNKERQPKPKIKLDHGDMYNEIVSQISD